LRGQARVAAQLAYARDASNAEQLEYVAAFVTLAPTALLGGSAIGSAATINYSSGAVLGKYGVLFGRGGQAGGGLLNSNNVLRIGYGWNGTGRAGKDVFRIAFGKKGGKDSEHIIIHTFKNRL
jgi:hypothetical protein